MGTYNASVRIHVQFHMIDTCRSRNFEKMSRARTKIYLRQNLEPLED